MQPVYFYYYHFSNENLRVCVCVYIYSSHDYLIPIGCQSFQVENRFAVD